MQCRCDGCATRSVAAKVLILSLSTLLVRLPIGKAGLPADYSPLGCYADTGSERIMQNMRKEGSMSAEECYFFCDDGLNTHFGTQDSDECWCAADPDLNKNGPALDPDECNMPCGGTAVGEHCGGGYRMTVYELTAYSRCKLEPFGESLRLGTLPSSKDDQRVGQPWDYQEKFDTRQFFKPAPVGSSSSSRDVISARSCDVEDDHKKLLAQVDVWQHAEKATPKVFCGIFTHHPNHSTQVKPIKDTWASHCDGFVAFSDVDDAEVHSFKIKHEGPEEYNNMWQKSRAIWKYINFHYIDDFDWFVLGGDDVFVIVENLRKYLLSDEIKRAAGGLKDGGPNPMYLGRRVRPFGENHRIYNYGGPSYVLNRASVRLLANHLDDDACQPHAKTFTEDVLVARCLRQNGVEAFDTRDALGRERFHPFTPAAHLGYRKPEKVVEDELVAGVLVAGWFVVQAIDFMFGRECCSRDSLSFHIVDEQLMRRLYLLIYSCPRDPVDWTATT